MKNKLKSMFVEETYFGLVEDACLEEEGTENVVFRSEHNWVLNQQNTGSDSRVKGDVSKSEQMIRKRFVGYRKV